MRFKMNRSALVCLIATSSVLAGCATNKRATTEKPRPVMNVSNQTSIQPMLSISCQRPAGAPLVYTVSLADLRTQAKVYSKTMRKALRKKRVLPTNYVPNKSNLSDGWDELELAYHPYIDNNHGGVTRLSGTITCGHNQGVSVENRYSYSNGLINYPLDIPSVENLSIPMQASGIGGYSLAVSLEQPSIQHN